MIINVYLDDRIIIKTDAYYFKSLVVDKILFWLCAILILGPGTLNVVAFPCHDIKYFSPIICVCFNFSLSQLWSWG